MKLFLNEDCMDVMKRYPDNYFDLAIVDPPYFSGPEKRKFYGRKVSPIGVSRLYGETLSFIATLPVKGTRISKQKQALFKIRLYQRIEKMGSEKLLEINRFIWSSICLEEFNKVNL